MDLLPPDDVTNITLWLGNIENDITETDIRDAIYSYGVIMNIHISRQGKCAFIEFLDRSMAENAARYLYNNLVIKGHAISVNWSKPKSLSSGSSASSSSSSGSGTSTNGAEFTMMAPPGMENAPVHMYSISNPPPPPPGKPDSNSNNTTTNTSTNTSMNKKRSATEQLYPSLKPDRLGSAT